MGRQSSNKFRIIAGDLRHRVLPFPDVPGLRPTPDRVRETLFNWLQLDIAGARCLDLFCGSGALALEALSRGAAEVTAVELSGEAVRSLRENARKLGLDAFRVVQQDALDWLVNTLEQPFDVIFLDPPYSLDLLPGVIEMIAAKSLLARGGFLYLEDDTAIDTLHLPEGWSMHRSRKAGKVYYGLVRNTG